MHVSLHLEIKPMVSLPDYLRWYYCQVLVCSPRLAYEAKIPLGKIGNQIRSLILPVIRHKGMKRSPIDVNTEAITEFCF